MEFRILGPLEVVDDGRPLDVGAAKQRALLAVLLLEANRVVSSDRLVAALWGEIAPETAQKALQVYVSHLRKVLGRERIRTRIPGYELLVEPGELDVERFEQLVAAGEYDDALRLWRGSPLADFVYEPFAQADIARLEEARLACVEARIERELGQGRHAAAVGELEALVREHPLREGLRAQLMLALYRSGRQADALEAYRAGRSLLADELGLDPSAELRELERGILAQDPALSTATEPGAAAATPEAIAARDDPPVAAPPARELRKTVTILVCDVVPSSETLDPEAVRRMETIASEELVPVLERHGATVERSLIGAVTALFGVPVVHEDDALRAVRAAVEARERLDALRTDLRARWDATLDLRVGIATGEVLTGGARGGPLATGVPVRAALDLHGGASPGSILLDQRTYRLVRDAVDADVVDGRGVLRALRDPTLSYESRLDSPMVGRTRERRRLRDAFEQAIADRSCQLFTILGAPGVGKSRLVREFVDGVAGEARVARGRCLPYGEGITYWPVVEAVRDAARLGHAESSKESVAKLAAFLEHDEEAELVARRLGEVLGLSVETTGAEEAFWAVRRFFEALARDQPLVLVFDDIHWGEPTFLDLVDHLSDRARDVPVLVLCVSRPELLEVRPSWAGGKLNATTTLLEPLSAPETEELVANLAGTAELDDQDLRRIVDAAGGNPLFVEELLALVLEEDGGDGSVEVPPTIQALLAARLDRLTDEERAVIEAAAVEGKVFHEGSIAELVGMPPADVDDHVSTLVRRELVRPDRPVFTGERAYQFRHLLIRDAAYDSIPKEARATLHEGHAVWLERRAGERALEFEEILGYHLEQAYRNRSDLGPVDDVAAALGRRAAKRLGAAGRRALARGDMPAAMNLASRAVSLLPPDDPMRVDVIPNVRGMQGYRGDLSWADRALAEAIEAGDDRLRAHALVQRGFLRLFTGEVSADELLSVARDTAAISERLGDDLGMARAWRLAAEAHYLARRASSGVEMAERAFAYARAAGDRFEVIEVVEWLLVLLLFGPCRVSEGVDRCRRLKSEIAGERDAFRAEALEAMAAVSLAWFEAAGGHEAEARQLLLEARAGMEAHGEVIPFVLFYGGRTQLLLGDTEAAESDFSGAHEFLRARGRIGHYGATALELAHVRYLAGRYDEADAFLEEAQSTLRPNDIWDRVHVDTRRAKVLARRGELEAAERLARQGVEFIAQSDFVMAHADAMEDLAEILFIAGRNADAAQAVGDAIRLFEQKGDVVSAARARERLGQL